MIPALYTLTIAFFLTSFLNGADAESTPSLNHSESVETSQSNEVGPHSAAPLPPSNSIPEPAAAMLGAIGFLFLLRRR